MPEIIDAKRNANLNSLSTSEMNNEGSTAFSSRTSTIAPGELTQNYILPVFTLQSPSGSVRDLEASAKSRKPRRWSVHGIRELLQEEVPREAATAPLWAFCFMSVSLRRMTSPALENLTAFAPLGIRVFIPFSSNYSRLIIGLFVLDRRHIVHRLLYLVRVPDWCVRSSSLISRISPRGALLTGNRQHRAAFARIGSALFRTKRWPRIPEDRPTSTRFFIVLRSRRTRGSILVRISFGIRSKISKLALLWNTAPGFVHPCRYTLRSVCSPKWVCHPEERT